MSRVIAVGHAALDRVYRIETFPPSPTKVRALAHVEAGGGMAANAAAAIARLGGDVELWSRTGDDPAAARIRELLVEDGVDIAWVRSFPGGRSSTSAIIVDAMGERLIVGERDASISTDPGWLPLARIRDAAVVIADLRWPEAVEAAFGFARGAAVTTLLDADLGGGAWLPRLLDLADYAIFSGTALDAFATGETDEQKLRHVRGSHPSRHVGVTRGSAGYAWIDVDGAVGFQPAFKVDVVDTTGAGDAFHGAFAWALANGHDEAECARIAAAAAAIKCRKLGGRAGLATRADLADLLTRGAVE
jgi:sulfofructose kinase